MSKIKKEITYSVQWEDKNNPEINGEGTAISDKNVVVAWAEKMNNKYPNLVHKVATYEQLTIDD